MTVMIFSKVANRSGKAKASGNPYSINMAEVLTPFQPSTAASSVLTGAGMDAVEVEVADNVYDLLFNTFTASFKGLPVPIDVETGLTRQSKLIVLGVKQHPRSS
ncbi:hypothetical protein HC024_11470 [Methylococcaceae bacterium WWC4]|nr:hypothetical protein [Methylococcaceae bacterium WWC4]